MLILLTDVTHTRRFKRRRQIIMNTPMNTHHSEWSSYLTNLDKPTQRTNASIGKQEPINQSKALECVQVIWLFFQTSRHVLIYLSTYYLPIYLLLYSSLLRLGRFSVSQSFTESVGFLGRGIRQSQGRYLHTGQHKHRINAHRHPCLERDSNTRFQRSSRRRRFMPLWSADMFYSYVWNVFSSIHFIWSFGGFIVPKFNSRI
jgi:hypothetical protein